MNRFSIVGALAVVVIGFGGRVQVIGAPIQTQMTYSTSGTIGTSGVNGAGTVSFEGVSDGTLTTGTKFDLGRFTARPAQDGSNTTFDQTPFEITLVLHSDTGSSNQYGDTTVSVKGFLNGSLNTKFDKPLMTNFEAYGTPPEYPPLFPTNVEPFPIGNFVGYLDIRTVYVDGQSIMVNLNVSQTVPEPGPIAVFACAIGFLVIQRRYRKAMT